MKTVLLDTNAVSALFNGDAQILDYLAVAERVCMSTVVIGELQAGFYMGSKVRENQANLDSLLSKPTVEILPVTAETSDYYGRLVAALRKAGHPIPVNDLWIAAQTLEQGAILITYDKHFHHVPGLRVKP
jgi:tRNA(fMet)-specific endonuclease VapC